MTSWWNLPTRSFKEGTARAKAAAYADKKSSRDNHFWLVCYSAFLSGYLKSQREKFPTLRVNLRLVRKQNGK
jgi:hypothetical protein